MKRDIEELLNRWPLIEKFALPEEANVVVVGAYQGLAMEALALLYPTANIVGFEPQLWAFQEAQERLRGYYKAIVYNIGLGTENALLEMGEFHTDGASFVNVGSESRTKGHGYVGDADNLLKMTDFEHIDLMIMNIEGYEYTLLPYLHTIGWLGKIDRLAVQWHWFPELGLDANKMDGEIANLTKDFILKIDDRPAWSYFVKGNLV